MRVRLWRVDGDWRELVIQGEVFRFLPGAPLFTHRGRVEPLASAPTAPRDTLLVLFISLLIGTPVLSFIGSIGAGLTLGLRGGGV